MEDRTLFGDDVLQVYEKLTADEQRLAALWGLSELLGKYEDARDSGAFQDIEEFMERHREDYESGKEWSADDAPESVEPLAFWVYTNEHPQLHALAARCARLSNNATVGELHDLMERYAGYEIDGTVTAPRAGRGR